MREASAVAREKFGVQTSRNAHLNQPMETPNMIFFFLFSFSLQPLNSENSSMSAESNSATPAAAAAGKGTLKRSMRGKREKEIQFLPPMKHEILSRCLIFLIDFFFAFQKREDVCFRDRGQTGGTRKPQKPM